MTSQCKKNRAMTSAIQFFLSTVCDPQVDLFTAGGLGAQLLWRTLVGTWRCSRIGNRFPGPEVSPWPRPELSGSLRNGWCRWWMKACRTFFRFYYSVWSWHHARLSRQDLAIKSGGMETWSTLLPSSIWTPQGLNLFWGKCLNSNC